MLRGTVTTVTTKDLSEHDICTKYFTGAIVSAGWDVHSQISGETGRSH